MRVSVPPVVWAGAALGLLALFAVHRAGGAGKLAASVVGATVTVATEATAEGVMSIGDALGVPRTDVNLCEAAIADGRMWDASFACPAGRFLSSLTGGARSVSSPDDRMSFASYESLPIVP